VKKATRKKPASKSTRPKEELNQQELELSVKLEQRGVAQDIIERLSREVLRTTSVKRFLPKTRTRLLSIDFIEDEKESKPTRIPPPPSRYRATIYDYANNRAVMVEGKIENLKEIEDEIEIIESGIQPLPSDEEFEAAVRILAKDPTLAPAIRERSLQPYRPMPPLINVELPDGRVERTLAVGLFSPNERIKNRIIGVNMIRESVLQELQDVALPSADSCGPPQDFNCPDSGSNGQVKITVTQGSTVLWTFVVVRPSASSGTNGSGIELRYVDYRGKRVLYRAHVPILNVMYSNEGASAGCGPTYRDWQNSETCFQASGTDLAPGFRLCPTPAKTILETGSDSGNFKGVAIYVQGQEVVLVSEMQAGWYRYISEWRLHANGTIRPRFGFAAGNNPCTCKAHHHHVYWRLDFDIRTAGNNVVEEFNDPPLIGTSNWHTKKYEIRRTKDAGRKRKWRVKNTQTGEGYLIVPGANDGKSDGYGVGDLWVLRYHSSEIDDGQGFTTDASLSQAHLDRFINGEVVENSDVVIWYAGHFLHDVAHGDGGSHIVGPDLVPFNRS
jgi:Copper amine oxidase, enzyme domain